MYSMLTLGCRCRLLLMPLYIVLLCVLSFSTANAAGSISADPTLTDGLVSYWPLDEKSGIRKDVHGNSILSESGIGGVGSEGGVISTGAEIRFEDDDYLEVADKAVLTEDLDWSLSLWVRFSSLPGNNQYRQLFSKIQNYARNTVFMGDIYNNAGSFRLRLYEASNAEYVAEHYSSDLSVGTWYNFVFVRKYNTAYDGLRVYLDGVPIATGSSGTYGTTNTGGTHFRIGSYIDGNDRVLIRRHDGIIDEVGLWNRALTAEEVARLYNDGKGLPYTLTADPTDKLSSVAFLPGIMGSRLYTDYPNGERRWHWESIFASDLAELALNPDGTSVNQKLYTKDIIDLVRPLSGFTSLITRGEGYRGWMTFMDRLVADGHLHEWKVLPYDWRLATDELFLRGVSQEGGKVSYVQEVSGAPYLLTELEGLAERSPTGKVTMIAHSNGGLVAKNLLRYLKETNDPLLAKIDTLVLVASPQLGTPKAVREVLHGIDMPGQNTVRSVLQNMSGAYGLLPSARLMSLLPEDEPVVVVDDAVRELKVLSDLAGTSLTAHEALTQFLRGETGVRDTTDAAGYLHPSKLNAALLEKADAMHAQVDQWSAPVGVRVVQVVGTGLWTPSGVHYGVKYTPSRQGKLPSLLTEWRANTVGDGTVLTISAESGPADTTYYLDLSGYNAHKDASFAHGTMLSAPVVQQLLYENVLRGGTELPLFTNKTGGKSSFPRFELRAYSPIDIHLHQQGKHTGILENEEPTELGRYFEQAIPNSHYEEWADVKYAGADFSNGEVDLEVYGTGKGTFTLEYDVFDGDTSVGRYAYKDIPVTEKSTGRMVLGDSGAPVLTYDMDGDGDADLNLSPKLPDEALSVSDLFARLRAYVQAADMPTALSVWIDFRLGLAEKQAEKGTKGNLTAAQAILQTVLWTVDLRKGSLITTDDAEVMQALLVELIDRL